MLELKSSSIPKANNQSRCFRPIKRISLFGFLIICGPKLWSQTSNTDFERIKLNSEEIEYSGIAISPDNNTIAISAKKSPLLKIVDWKNLKIIQEFNTGSWNNGSRINLSFLPGNKSLLIAIGKQLIKWNIEFNDTEQ